MIVLIFKKRTLAKTTLISASTVLSNVMFSWSLVRVCSHPMIKKRFKRDSPMERAKGYRVPFTKAHVPEEKLWGLMTSSPLTAFMAVFHIPLARAISVPVRKSCNHPGISSHSLL